MDVKQKSVKCEKCKKAIDLRMLRDKSSKICFDCKDEEYFKKREEK